MRYNPQDEVIVVHIKYIDEDGHENDTTYKPYMPWCHKLPEVKLEVFTCVEHHQVPYEFIETDPRRDDGFVFEDELGERWANQYPTSYNSQLDDTNHWTFFKLETDFDGKEVDEYHSGYLGPWMRDARHVLNGVLRGIRYMEKDGDQPEHAIQLKKWLNTLIALLEDKFDLKVEIKPLVIRYKDGHTEERPDILQAHLIPTTVLTEAVAT